MAPGRARTALEAVERLQAVYLTPQPLTAKLDVLGLRRQSAPESTRGTSTELEGGRTGRFPRCLTSASIAVSDNRR